MTQSGSESEDLEDGPPLVKVASKPQRDVAAALFAHFQKPDEKRKQMEANATARLQRALREAGGGDIPPGWSVLAKRRENGISKGDIDYFFFAPDGKRYRSQKEAIALMLEDPTGSIIKREDDGAGPSTAPASEAKPARATSQPAPARAEPSKLRPASTSAGPSKAPPSSTPTAPSTKEKPSAPSTKPSHKAGASTAASKPAAAAQPADKKTPAAVSKPAVAPPSSGPAAQPAAAAGAVKTDGTKRKREREAERSRERRKRKKLEAEAAAAAAAGGGGHDGVGGAPTHKHQPSGAHRSTGGGGGGGGHAAARPVDSDASDCSFSLGSRMSQLFKDMDGESDTEVNDYGQCLLAFRLERAIKRQANAPDACMSLDVLAAAAAAGEETAGAEPAAAAAAAAAATAAAAGKAEVGEAAAVGEAGTAMDGQGLPNGTPASATEGDGGGVGSAAVDGSSSPAAEAGADTAGQQDGMEVDEPAAGVSQGPCDACAGPTLGGGGSQAPSRAVSSVGAVDVKADAGAAHMEGDCMAVDHGSGQEQVEEEEGGEGAGRGKPDAGRPGDNDTLMEGSEDGLNQAERRGPSSANKAMTGASGDSPAVPAAAAAATGRAPGSKPAGPGSEGGADGDNGSGSGSGDADPGGANGAPAGGEGGEHADRAEGGAGAEDKAGAEAAAAAHLRGTSMDPNLGLWEDGVYVPARRKTRAQAAAERGDPPPSSKAAPKAGSKAAGQVGGGAAADGKQQTGAAATGAAEPAAANGKVEEGAEEDEEEGEEEEEAFDEEEAALVLAEGLAVAFRRRKLRTHEVVQRHAASLLLSAGPAMEQMIKVVQGLQAAGIGGDLFRDYTRAVRRVRGAARLLAGVQHVTALPGPGGQ